MAALKVPHPRVEVQIAGRDVTAALTPYLLSVDYTDHLEGEADTVDIQLEDVDGRFRADWYPRKGDRTRISIGFDDGVLLTPNDFEIDEIELEGPPDVVTLKCIGAGVTKPYRTRQGRAYENTTLAQIAQAVAVRLHLQLVGTIEQLKVRRVTQVLEDDLTFLMRVAKEYGYAFSVRGSKLVFYKRTTLREAAVVLTLDRDDLTRYRVKDKVLGVVATAVVSYHDPRTKRLHRQTVRDTTHGLTSADTLNLNTRAETPDQATAKAQAALDAANNQGAELTANVHGDVRLVSGINIALTGLGKLNVTWHIIKSRHSIKRDGAYSVEFDAQSVGAING